MKPIINPWLIYLAGICDPIKIVLGFFGFMLTIICIVLLCFILSESLTKDEEHKYLKYIKKTIIACISCINNNDSESANCLHNCHFQSDYN